MKSVKIHVQSMLDDEAHQLSFLHGVPRMDLEGLNMDDMDFKNQHGHEY